MSNNFPYGHNIDKYIEEAIDKLKYTYPWTTREMIEKHLKYTIEKVGNRYHYIEYSKYANGEERREDLGNDYNKFISHVIDYSSFYIENENDVIETFKFDLPGGVESHGWYLEQYYFRKHEYGTYSAYVQAGNRSTGGSRSFFIPPSYFASKTYDEFLDKYCELVPANFGLTKQDLLKVKGLKEFLGY